MCGELEFEVSNLGGAAILRHVKGYLNEGRPAHLIFFVIVGGTHGVIYLPCVGRATPTSSKTPAALYICNSRNSSRLNGLVV